MGLIRITARFLGALADALGEREEVVYLDSEAPKVSDVIEIIRARFPAFREAESKLPIIWVYVNEEQVLPTRKLKDGDIVLLMPPMYEGG